MKRDRRDEEVWAQQRAAQRRTTPEQRLRQNDAMSRLRVESDAARKRASGG
jgi:hypothetical protein